VSTLPRHSLAARLLMLPIRGWRLLSIHLTPRCRFHPSCSAYALEALATHGAVRGTWLAARRVARCNPWGGSGLDPVPARSNTRSLSALPGAGEPLSAARAGEPVPEAAASSLTVADSMQEAG
jgi:putative membrane protein insertion efficiency factor